jgi:hypothetical protein
LNFLKFSPAKIDKNYEFVINDFLDLIDFQHDHEMNQCKFNAAIKGLSKFKGREVIVAEGETTEKNGISCDGLFFIDPKTGLSLLSKVNMKGLVGINGTKADITWTMAIEY